MARDLVGTVRAIMVPVIIGALTATATTGIHIGAVVIGTAAAGIIGKTKERDPVATKGVPGGEPDFA